MNLGELAYPDVPEGAVHLLPLGATEPHGPHAPLSTDTVISVGICERAAERIAASVGPLILVNSHFEPEQVETLRATGLPLFDLTRRRNAERLTEEFRTGSCHAGRYETSLVLADRPQLVHADRMRELEERHVDMPAAIRDGRTDFLAMGMVEAYCGAPAESSAQEGRETFETLADLLVELIREVAS